MIRVVAFLVGASLLALGAVWLADRPGAVTITWPWLGQAIETTVSAMVYGVVAVVIVAIALWSLLRLLLRSPKRISRAMHERRHRKGHDAIARGLIAIGAGDARAALRHAGATQNSREPLALLLRAQTAQLAGDRAGADEAFRAMTEHHDTRLLGLRGLFIEAQRRNDPVAARLAAEAAAKEAPALPWAGQAVLEFRCAAGDWEGALHVLEMQRRGGMLSRAEGRRRRAVLLTARAITLEDEDREVARALVIEATRLAPDLVPAAAFAGRLLAEAGEPRKAAKIIETAWKQNPHPDLAEVYANVRLSDSARDRLARTQALARLAPDHSEGALAVARAALDARELATAQGALAPFAREPSQRVASLMAQLCGLEGDEGRAREWMARAVTAVRDPAWTADGYVSDRWLPVSPVTGKLDAFQWRVPLEEIGERPVLEAPREVASPPLTGNGADAAPASPFDAPPADAAPAAAAPTPAVAPAPAVTQTDVAVPAPGPAAAPTRPAPRPAPIVPLAQIPDDPGPDAAGEEALGADPHPEASAQSDRLGTDSWQRIRQLFR
jgi:HemY protein